MKTKNVPLTLYALITLGLIAPAVLQGIELRRQRPPSEKCDGYGGCSTGYIEEVDDYTPEKKRPAVLTRDDFPVRPLDDKDLDKGRTGGGYNPKPTVDRDDDAEPSSGGRPGGGYKPNPPADRDGAVKPSGGGRPGSGGYDPKLPVDRDDDIKPSGGGRPGGGGGYGSGYKPKPPSDRDESVKPSGGGRPGSRYDPKPPVDKDHDPPRPGRGGGYKPLEDSDEEDIKPYSGGRPGAYDPKPPPGRDDYLKPSGGRPGYGGGYKPLADSDEEDIKPYGGGRPGAYDPKPPPGRDDYIKPSGGRPYVESGGYGGGYKPKPDRDEDSRPPPRGGRPGSGGYDRNYDHKPSYDRVDDIKPAVRPSDDRGYRGSYKPDEDDYKPPTRGRPSVGGSARDDYDIKPSGGDRGGYDTKRDDSLPDDYGKVVDDYVDDDDGKPVPVAQGNCICVPYYQCAEGGIVTDGAGIIDARNARKPDPVQSDEIPLDGKLTPSSCGPYHVCCSTPETSTIKPYEHRCGVRNPSGINSRILSPSNKGEADFGEWPWQAAVLKSEGTVNIFQCGGVLIDKYHVLTVAHCVFHLHHLTDYPLKVRLGEWDTQSTTEFLAHEDYRVSKIVVHPEYRNTSLWNDVAVLRLQDPVPFAPHIDTVCLPRTWDEGFAGQNCVVTGWGKDAYKGGTFSNVMKEVALQVIDNYKCEEMLRKTRLGRFFQLHEGFLCAGGEYGIDSCKGDGGGPLVCYRKDKSYALAGLVSWGIDCGQPEVPGVYVKIQKYLPWIAKTTGVAMEDYWPKT